MIKRVKSNSLLISDQKCTICIATSLCIWLICVIIFISHSNNYDGSSSTSSSNTKSSASPLIINNIPSVNKLNNIKNVNYFESLSPELSKDGWKPIYLHTKNVRMPIEEMDYVLEKYWFPRIQDEQQQDNDDDYQPEVDIDDQQQQEEEGMDLDENIDFSELRRNSKKNKKHRIIGNEKKKKEEKHKTNKQRDAPSTSSSSNNNNMVVPSSWSHRCYPSSLNDKECVSSSMNYWSRGTSIISSPPSITDKYVTFLKDCGGFNNIRQGFEYHAMIAWLTDRTLVIPPDTPWYLIDRGQITRGREGLKEENEPSWPDGSVRKKGTSNYDIWFDLDDLSLIVPVITTPQFIKREFDNLAIPHEYYDSDIVNKNQHSGSNWLRWLNNKADELNVNLNWAQLTSVLYWPSQHDVELKNSNYINEAWIDHRKPREYTKHLSEQKFIHFPSCNKANPAGLSDYRYLGQIARSVAFDNKEMDNKFKQILRDHVHLKSNIMEYASLVISILGAFKYSSYHIRRNELQYKYVFASAEDSYSNTKQLIGDNEIIYIATDEANENFFKVFEENGKRKVYRWKDFFGPNAKFEETKNIQVPGKIHGEVEMAICAMGRIFFGTKESTFSEYIARLRGYFNAPYTQTLYHHYKLTTDVDESSRISKSNPGKPYRGQIYKIAFPDLWEDIKDLP